ncbi:MAG: transposase [Candidatus Cloacimonetes bacterium]|nr:transposase [Candidatus Cloacimonadota bacterium]
MGEKQEVIAIRRAQLCSELHDLRTREGISLSQAITAYLELYNTGVHHSLIYATLGRLSASTLRRWYNAWLDGERDWRALVPQWRSGNVGHEVPQDDFNWLIGVLHSDGKPPVAAALRMWHLKLRTEGREAPVSDRTMQRAIKVFAQRHAGRWAYMRRGAKYFREHYLPSVLQDGSRVPVGDLWYSDGCLLNFEVINPYTGNASRPMFVPFMDYASGMIVGFDLDFSENRRVIASAYRNAICLWGFVPLYIKWDNGRAFRSLQGKKLNRAQLAELRQLEQDEIAEISGNIYATGVLEILNSLPYNPTGKAKIERFFGTLDGGLERFLPGYRGASIEDKPAHLGRNEKHLQQLDQKLRGNITLTLHEAKQVLNWWILDIYAHMQHPEIKGKTRLQVWQEGLKSIDDSRRRNPEELWQLMLCQEVKKLDRSGVKVRGLWYYDEALFDYVGQRVYVRYDQMDDRYVFVYDSLKQPICRALVRDVHDPLVTVRGSEEEKLRFTHEMKRKNRLEKRMRKDADALAEMTRDGGMFMMEAIGKLREMKGGAPLELTNLDSSLPHLPQEPVEGEPIQEEEPDENEVVIPREFLDAIGVSQ